MPKFKEGDRVILDAVPEYGLPEEHGTVICHEDDYPGMYFVEVDEKMDLHDDALREVHEDQLKPEVP